MLGPHLAGVHALLAPLHQLFVHRLAGLQEKVSMHGLVVNLVAQMCNDRV